MTKCYPREGIEPLILRKFGLAPVIKFQVATVLFNKIVSSWSHIKNLICLLTKYYIYRQHCLELNVDFNDLVSYILRVENIEKYYATVNHKLHKHLRKWKIPQIDNQNIDDYIAEYLRKVQ